MTFTLLRRRLLKIAGAVGILALVAAFSIVKFGLPDIDIRGAVDLPPDSDRVAALAAESITVNHLAVEGNVSLLKYRDENGRDDNRQKILKALAGMGKRAASAIPAIICRSMEHARAKFRARRLGWGGFGAVAAGLGALLDWILYLVV